MQITRKDFLRYVGVSALSLSLDKFRLQDIQRVLADASAPPVLWLSGASCTGCSVSLLNAVNPTIDQVLLNTISLKYHTTLMAAAGDLAVAAATSTAAAGGHVLVVEGAIQTGEEGRYCYVWDENGRSVTMAEAVRALAANAAYVVAVGTCAAYGGIPRAYANAATVGLGDFLGRSVINVPGCAPHPDWVIGTLVGALTGNLPQLDSYGRPTQFFTREEIHERCPRHEREEASRFGQPNRCMEELGCKGPHTHADCDQRKWNNGQNWCIGVNGLCIGCVEPDFPAFPLHGSEEHEESPTPGSGPNTVSVSPDRGYCRVGVMKPFVAAYRHASGWQNIRYADLLINVGPDPRKCVCARYDVAQNLAYIHDPLLDSWRVASAGAPGEARVLMHPWMRLRLADMRVAADGDDLVVTWPIVFTANDSGFLHRIYLRAEGVGGATTGWDDLGVWAVNRIPTMIAPDLNQQAVAVGQKVLFLPRYQDQDGFDNLAECHFLLCNANPNTSPEKAFQNAVYLKYDHRQGRMYLRRADNSSWTPADGVEPRTDFRLQHRMVAAYGPASRVIKPDGATLQVNWLVSFTAAYKGRHQMYMRAVDKLGAAYGGDTGWKWKGWITVQ